jgi:hypothetical protein
MAPANGIVRDAATRRRSAHGKVVAEFDAGRRPRFFPQGGKFVNADGIFYTDF